MKRALAFLAGVCLAAGLSASSADAQTVGAVYTMTNAPGGNAVMAFDRAPDGTLSWSANFATGGLGTGGGLGNQGGVTLSEDQRWLLVVNAGSHDLTVFAVEPGGLRWVDQVPTGGTTPVSVTVHGRLVYVLNAGSDGIAGFYQNPDGTLDAIPGSSRPLSGAGAGAAQIQFSSDGRLLVVTEKATNTLTVFAVDRHGRAGMPDPYPSAGATPFGFAFGKRNQLFVSEAAMGAAGASTVSSYVADAAASDKLAVITPSAATNETAACWVVVDRAGRFAYTTNTGDGTVSGFAIAPHGQIALLDADGKTGLTGAGPIDAAFSGDDRFLYVLNSGDNSLSAFRVGPDGSLHGLTGMAGLPAGANGLAAR